MKSRKVLRWGQSSKKDSRQMKNKIATFPIPFTLEEVQGKGKTKKNISISTNNSLSKQDAINQAINLHSQGNIKEAIKYYQYCINQNFNDPIIFSNYAIILKELGKLKEAEILVRKAIDIKPNYAEAHLNLGNILKGLGKFKEAEILVRKAIQIKPNYAEAHNNLGNILSDLGDLKEAEVSQRKAIKLKSDFAMAHFNLGSILQDLGNLKEAEISTRKAINLKPDFAIAHSNLGTILGDLGNFEEAEISYSNALSVNPGSSLALMNRAQLFFDQKKFDLALKDADACNNQNARAFALEILYASGKVDEVYERIQKTDDVDRNNIRMAAFSSFISEKEKKESSHNFCPQPISFLHFTNLKFHLTDYDEFIREMVKELLNIKTVWNPQNLSTYNGFHTPTSINLFSNPPQKISLLQSIIFKELNNYYLKFKNELCSYIQNWPSKQNIFGWHVILKKQGYQSAHIHPGGWLSGVIYLKVVPPLEKDEGAIEFSLNGQNYSYKDSPKLTYQPKLGDIILFPSSLHHRTIPFTTDNDRIVIAFDLMPEGYKSYGISY